MWDGTFSFLYRHIFSQPWDPGRFYRCWVDSMGVADGNPYFSLIVADDNDVHNLAQFLFGILVF